MHAQLKIGDMSCIEYAAMMGYHQILQHLIDMSINAATLKQYFVLNGELFSVATESFKLHILDNSCFGLCTAVF